MSTCWIDVYPTDANLLAASGNDDNIKIYDRRVSKIVKTFKSIHSSKTCLNTNDLIHLRNSFINILGWIRFVRWIPSGDMLVRESYSYWYHSRWR